MAAVIGAGVVECCQGNGGTLPDAMPTCLVGPLAEYICQCAMALMEGGTA